MKHTGLLITILLMLFTLFGLAACSTSVENSTVPDAANSQTGIWVTGVGKVTITPDIANISLGVYSQEASVDDAMTKTNAAMSKVLAVLKSNGIEDKDIQTQQFSITPAYTYDSKTGNQTISGYQVTNLVNVTVRNTSSTAAVIGAVAEAGGDLTRINGVNFTVADPIQYYTQARQAAINDADHKAQKLAGLYGVKLDKPTVVFETNSSSPISHSYGLNAPQAVPTPTIVVNAVSLGSTDITLYIQASYPIIK